ncbi:MAG: hypothetical protein AB7E85_05220 [Pseudobdellovibrionaceae bacterium]
MVMDKDFQSAREMSKFSYRPNPLHERSYMILEAHGSRYEPVGNYTVLDLAEERTLTEKKIINLISLLNGKAPLLDLQKEVKGTQLLYNDTQSEGSQRKVIFYKQDGTGVSRENALLLIEEGVWGHA